MKGDITFQSQVQFPSSNHQHLCPRSATDDLSQPQAQHLRHKKLNELPTNNKRTKNSLKANAISNSPCPCCIRESMLPSGPFLSTCRQTVIFKRWNISI